MMYNSPLAIAALAVGVVLAVLGLVVGLRALRGAPAPASTDEEYDRFVSASPGGAAAQVSEMLIGSLGHLDALPPKAGRFDRDRFVADVERFAGDVLAERFEPGRR